MQFYFSIIHFSRKWPSRMTNLSRQVYIQIIYTSVDQAKIDFITLALVSRNCPTYFSLLPLVSITCPTMSNLFHCFFHWFSAVVRHIATFYHRLSSVVQSVSLVWASAFISFFFPVLGTILKGVLCSKNTLQELDLTSYPFWMVLWQLSSCSSMQFYSSLRDGNRPHRIVGQPLVTANDVGHWDQKHPKVLIVGKKNAKNLIAMYSGPTQFKK